MFNLKSCSVKNKIWCLMDSTTLHTFWRWHLTTPPLLNLSITFNTVKHCTLCRTTTYSQRRTRWTLHTQKTTRTALYHTVNASSIKTIWTGRLKGAKSNMFYYFYYFDNYLQWMLTSYLLYAMFITVKKQTWMNNIFTALMYIKVWEIPINCSSHFFCAMRVFVRSVLSGTS